MFSSSVPGTITAAKCREEASTPPTTTIDDRSAPSYDRTATLDRIAQKFSLSRGSAALKPQVLARPPRLVAPFDAMLLAFIENCIRSDASANLFKTVADSFQIHASRYNQLANKGWIKRIV